MARASTYKTSPQSAKAKRAASKRLIQNVSARRSSARTKRSKKSGPITALMIEPVAIGRGGTKQARVLAMLCEPSGTTIEDIMAATGWQAHSVRGFFAGVVRKKLKLTLTSEAGQEGRIYRVTENSSGSASSKISAVA